MTQNGLHEIAINVGEDENSSPPGFPAFENIPEEMQTAEEEATGENGTKPKQK